MKDYNVEDRLITKDDWEEWLNKKDQKEICEVKENVTIKFEGEWHKYPEEKPKKDDDYLVSVKIEDESFTLTSCFDTSIDAFGILSDKYVTAWAELPEPYKEES